MSLYYELVKEGRLGSGECSAIACAIIRQYGLVIDDIRARKQAFKILDGRQLEILNTQDIFVKLTQDKMLSVTETDTIKNLLQKLYKFTFKFASFLEVSS